MIRPNVRNILFAVTVVCASVAPATPADLSGFFPASKVPTELQVDHAEWASLLSQYVLVDPAGVNRFAYGKVAYGSQ